MGSLKVVDQSFEGYNDKFRLLFINGIPQTIMRNNENDKTSFWEYDTRISALASLKKDKNALLIGMGGGAIAKELKELNFNLDIVDIDKRMFQIAQDYFFFKPSKKINFIEDDARHYVKLCNKKYDVIVIDVCSGEVQPTNLFTLEGVKEMKKCIENEGIIMIQYQEKINNKAISGSQSIAKTFINNGFKAYQNIEKGEVTGVILAFSTKEIFFDNIDTNNLTQSAKNKPWLRDFLNNPFTLIEKPSKNSILLQDDFPLLEKINANTIKTWRTIMNKNYGLRLIKG